MIWEKKKYFSNKKSQHSVNDIKKWIGMKEKQNKGDVKVSRFLILLPSEVKSVSSPLPILHFEPGKVETWLLQQRIQPEYHA